MGSGIEPTDVLPGDVLLYRSDSLIAWAIRQLDGTDVSHAGLCLNGDIAEALITEGLTRKLIRDSIAGSDWVEVRRLRAAVDTLSPVLDVAMAYLNDCNRYAYEQILLLAGICMTRKLDLRNPLLRKIVRSAMQKATQWLEYLHGQGKEPMICSEFVYRAYDEALTAPSDPYSLQILSQKTGEPSRWFSCFRRRRGIFSGESPPEAPSVHPDSLLAQLQSEDKTSESLPNAAAKSAATPPEPAEDLDLLIQRYRGERDGTEGAAPTMARAEAEVSMDELLECTRMLMAQWAHVDARKDETETRLDGAPAGVPEPTARTLADFVTPGDLLKSPSLVTVGRL